MKFWNSFKCPIPNRRYIGEPRSHRKPHTHFAQQKLPISQADFILHVSTCRFRLRYQYVGKAGVPDRTGRDSNSKNYSYRPHKELSLRGFQRYHFLIMGNEDIPQHESEQNKQPY
jgi:hypothetical protein